MSGDNYTQYKGNPADLEDTHVIVSKADPLPVTLQSESVATTTDTDTAEMSRDSDLLCAVNELVSQMKILNEYIGHGFGFEITKEDEGQ